MGDLYDAIRSAAGEKAMYWTGSLLSKDMDALQHTWIRLVAELGFYKKFSYKKWYDVVCNIREFIQSEEVNVIDGYQISCKLCLLYQNAVGYESVPKRSLVRLRGMVCGVFEGKERVGIAEDKLRAILPKPSNEREFCLKIAKGFILTWTDQKSILLRDALEYVCRKEYVVENDFMEFLWGLFRMLCDCEAAYVLYKCFFKKKEKWRAGLLYAVHASLEGGETWTVNERHILEQIERMTPDLWREWQESIPVAAPSKLDILNAFMPYSEQGTEEFQEPVLEEIKKIKVK